MYPIIDNIIEMARNKYHGRSITTEQLKKLGYTAFISIALCTAISYIFVLGGLAMKSFGSHQVRSIGRFIVKAVSRIIDSIKMVFFSFKGIIKNFSKNEKKRYRK